MKLLYMIIATFVQVLLTSFVLYTCASPMNPNNEQSSRVQPVYKLDPTVVAPAIPISAPIAPKPAVAASVPAPAAAPVVVPHHVEKSPVVPVSPVHQTPQEHHKHHAADPVVSKQPVEQLGAKKAIDHHVPVQESPVVIRESINKKHDAKLAGHSPSLVAKEPAGLDARSSHPVEIAQPKLENAHKMMVKTPESVVEPKKAEMVGVEKHVEDSKKIVQPEPVPASMQGKSSIVADAKPVALSKVAPVESQMVHPVEPKQQPASPSVVVEPVASVQVSRPLVEAPIVKGGQGPLHLLAATLCSYQPDRPTGDEQISNLYAQRAALRKSLFDFMSLRFTNLEKISNRLNPGLEIMPPKPINVDSYQQHPKSSSHPSHGWPVVGKCTAHDLKLMAEAAWCEGTDSLNSEPLQKGRPSSLVNQQQSSRVVVPQQHVAPVAAQPAEVVAQQSVVQDPVAKLVRGQRSIDEFASLLPVELNSSPNSPMGVPKLADSIISTGPIVGSQSPSVIDQRTLNSLNLTQKEFSDIQVRAGLTQECKRNALRLSKALFNHLAEDQTKQSESWPKLYAQLQEDECARKRLIDIVTALSGYRTEASSIRRDNVEFAFAMDDLRSKVLETEVTAPLTFDRHFIEVEQFLQQSVKLMLANIDPERAKITSARYRSLMPGPSVADDQCVQLHQLLLAKTHPQECNPNQYGQLPDILRMAANSLALWSIESELSRLGAARNLADVHPISVSENRNECIANLVSS